MDLRVTGVCKQRALAVGSPRSRSARAFRVRGKEHYVAVAPPARHYDVSHMCLDLTGDEVASHDPSRSVIDLDQIEHFGAWKHLDGAGVDLLLQSLVGSQKKLLPRLAASVEGTRDLRTAVGPIGQQPTVLA